MRLNCYSGNEPTVIESIKRCKDAKHFQQVAFSVHRMALTKICFDCNEVVTSMMKEE